MKKLNERSLVVKETGEKIPFSYVKGQMRQIIEAWEAGRPITLEGCMSDAKWFSGEAAGQLKLAADFVSGEETPEGDVYYNTARKTPVVQLGELAQSTTLSLVDGRGSVTMAL